ncbi:MAG: hypothetical protein AB7N65_19150 [Vicinamibacterales bacterium]
MNDRRVRAGGVFAFICALASVGAASARPNAAPGTDASALEATPCTAVSARLPDNVRMHRDLLPRVRVMLRRSPTFRRQCHRLAEAPWVHVAVGIDPAFNDHRRFRAMSVIQRPNPALLLAVVTVQALADPAMWVAHEFEHILEQMERVNLTELAEKRKAVWRTSEDVFETARAVRAGEAVLAEVRGDDDHNFVD